MCGFVVVSNKGVSWENNVFRSDLIKILIFDMYIRISGLLNIFFY